MVSTYLQAVATKRDVDAGLRTTHQGGEAYSLDVQPALKQVLRFLILGSEGGTFYVSEKELTAANIKSVARALDEDGIATVKLIRDVSVSGRAPKNEPALLALAMAASYQNTDEKYAEKVRSYALSRDIFPMVARTGTHLFHFAAYVDAMRGWGSGLRKGVARWFTSKDALTLAHQVTKYQQRDGWAMSDLLRLSHPIATDAVQNDVFKYVVDGELPSEIGNASALQYLQAVEDIKHETDTKKIINLINDYNLPREVIPTQALREAAVWEALLYAGRGMPMTAMIRNLGNLTKIGLVTQGSSASQFVNERLRDQDAITKSRVHPIDLLKAKYVYQSNKGLRGDSTWNSVQSVVSSLEAGFYLSFGNVEPTGKRLLLALDVSSSMQAGENHGYSYGYGSAGLAGVPGLSPRIASAAIALITAKTEREYETVGFQHQLVDLRINEHDNLDSAIRKAYSASFGGTDCSLPFKYAKDANKHFDAFIVYTDNETGRQNPSAALRAYRKSSGIHDAKLIVNAMASNGFSIADPTDVNMLDVVGFDTSAPQVMSMFIRGI